MTFMLLFLPQLADIKKLLTRSIRLLYHSWRLKFYLWFFPVKTDSRIVCYHHATPPPSPMCWM